MRRELSVYERKILDKVLSGKYDPNGIRAQKVLSRLHVAIALESLLDMYGLSDDKLCARLKGVLYRGSIMTKTGESWTTTDANALQAIRLIWQVRGKLNEGKQEPSRGGVSQLDDKQLDAIIKSGAKYIKQTTESIVQDKGQEDKGNGTRNNIR